MTPPPASARMHDAGDPAELIEKMAAQVAAQKLSKPVLIGIHSGGVWVAERLLAALAPKPQFGTLDISFYRDDFSRVGLNPQVKASDLPPVDGRDIILVDDVLHTGRTVRAALNEIFSYGRPERICLAVLIERPGRELPIQADVTGRSLALAAGEQVKLSRAADGCLALDVISTGARA